MVIMYEIERDETHVLYETDFSGIFIRKTIEDESLVVEVPEWDFEQDAKDISEISTFIKAIRITANKMANYELVGEVIEQEVLSNA